MTFMWSRILWLW